MLIRTTTILAAALNLGTSHAEETRPNIVFFLVDDLSHKTLGYAGDKIVITPNIDKLAAKGTNFKNCFASTSICAASRASVLTGRYERGHRFTFGTPPLHKSFLKQSYPIQLNNTGYHTGFIGKYGVKNHAEVPTKTLFDVYHPLNRDPFFKKQLDGTKKHITSICADKADSFIAGSPKDKPFCLSISYNAVHAEDSDKVDHFPWPKSSDNLYNGITFPKPPLHDKKVFEKLPNFLRRSENRRRFHWRWDTPEKYQKNMLGYYRMISGVDTSIGRVIDSLTKHGYAENTVIIFMSDNGYYMANRGLAGKWSHYEESLRIPLVIFDPRIKEHSSTNEKLVLNLDIATTITNLAGIKKPQLHQGKSLVPLLSKGTTTPKWRTDFLCEHHMKHKYIPKWEGVRNQRFVYARYTQENPVYEFLHDLEDDPQQLNNLAKEKDHQELLESLRKRCDELITQNK